MLSLVIGLSLVVVNATVQESFRRALLYAVDRSLVGDAFVSTKGRFLSATVQPMRGHELTGIPAMVVARGHELT